MCNGTSRVLLQCIVDMWRTQRDRNVQSTRRLPPDIHFILISIPLKPYFLISPFYAQTPTLAALVTRNHHGCLSPKLPFTSGKQAPGRSAVLPHPLRVGLVSIEAPHNIAPDEEMGDTAVVYAGNLRRSATPSLLISQKLARCAGDIGMHLRGVYIDLLFPQGGDYQSVRAAHRAAMGY